MKTRLHVVIGNDIRSTEGAVKNTAENEDLGEKWDKNSDTDTSNDDNDSGDDGGDALSYFEKLANDD